MVQRRDVLRAAGALAAGAGLTACAGADAAVAPHRAHGPVRTRPWQSAEIIEENRRRGTTLWARTAGTPDGVLEGFFDTTSAGHGEVATLFVRSRRPYRVEAYRLGHYAGAGGRLVARTRWLRAHPQPGPKVNLDLGTVWCPWNPSWRFEIDERFVPGCYLFRLVADNGWAQWVPLTVRPAHPGASFLVVNSVTTWQAYNPWGGWSLYGGPTGRADVVSFDRPYALGHGQSNFLFNEFPVVFHMESLGLDVGYWTDVDLHRRGPQASASACVVSLGHDEYWTWQMREAALRARDSGVNLAFLGANYCYRQVRLEPTSTGPDRKLVNYRSTEDPIFSSRPHLTTVNWSSPPVSRPESEFGGSIYGGFESESSRWDLVVTSARSWLWDGTGAHGGTRLRGLERNEFNRFDPSSGLAERVEILGHSPVGDGQFSDATYVTVPSGAGVLSTGTSTWIYAMQNSRHLPPRVMARPRPGVTSVVLGAMANLYELFGRGPAARHEPSRPNWHRFY